MVKSGNCVDKFVADMSKRGIQIDESGVFADVARKRLSGVRISTDGLPNTMTPTQVMMCLDNYKWYDFGIVNNAKVIQASQNEKIQEYWDNYRTSMVAGNGVEVIWGGSVSIGLTTDPDNYAKNNLFMECLGQVGNTDEAIMRNDEFLDTVIGPIIIQTIKDGLSDLNTCVQNL